ncbi:hypothetical protein GE253_04955 [Niveispirillum sp. SYP-B3756]|uniref:flagellin n=1 Tax=Niveispirillum sp. SYP-B3756 TaxID=2662178 RepID=UPI00129123E5|nr:flagellin [Niveispirillum sp. SYP-B3756]MQP64692.1 hypothetical protein [Niveispirillum sp. SYP-B3756]
MTMIRVSTLSMARQTRNNVAQMQGEMMKLQQEQASGTKMDVAGENGSRTATLISLRNTIDEINQFDTNMTGQAARLSTMQEALTQARASAQTIRDLALAASGSQSQTSNATIKGAATDAIKAITNMLNSSQSGRFLFGGTRFDQQPLQQPDAVAASGLSPNAAVTQVINAFGGTAALTSPAQVDALIDGPNGIGALFNDTRVPAAGNYANTFFNGSTAPVVGRVEGSVTITYNATAGDQSVRDMMQGLYMLSAVRAEDVPDEAYQQLAGRAMKLINSGLEKLTQTQSLLGLNEQTVSTTQENLRVQKGLVNNQIVKLEEADPYESSLRLTVLKTQLEATFSVTASLGKLSLMNYL